MSENEMPERIWIEGPCVVTNDPSDQKYYVHEDKYDYLTDDYLTEYRRTPSLPDVMEDGYVVMKKGNLCIWIGEDDDGNVDYFSDNCELCVLLLDT